jgi:hypothetical protein
MKDGAASVAIWLPPGRWFDTNRGELIDGGRTVTRDYALDEVPLFARAGAAIPMNPSSVRKLQTPDDGRLVLRVYPGGKAQNRVYSDAGDSEGYRSGEYAFSAVETQRDARGARVTLQPRQGRYAGMPDTRQVTVELPVSAYPERVTVNGIRYERSDQSREGSWHYDGQSLTARVVVPAQQAGQPLEVSVAFAADAPSLDGLIYRMKRTATAIAWVKERWEVPTPVPDDLSLAGQLGQLIDYHPEQLPALVRQFDARLAKLVTLVNQSHAAPEVKAQFAAMIEAIRQSG